MASGSCLVAVVVRFCNLEAYFFLVAYTLPLPKSRKVGSSVGKLLGRKKSSPKHVPGDPTSNLFFDRDCLGASDASGLGMEWCQGSKFSSLFALLWGNLGVSTMGISKSIGQEHIHRITNRSISFSL